MSDQLRMTSEARIWTETRAALTGALTAPTTLTIKVRDPSGNIDTYTLAGSTISTNSTGKYYVNVSCDEAGIWAYEIAATGTVARTVEGSFEVLGSDYGL